MSIKFYTSPKNLYPQNKFLATPLLDGYVVGSKSFRLTVMKLSDPSIDQQVKYSVKSDALHPKTTAHSK